ncbi:MAG: phage tail sheath family protein [Nitrospira sp.]|nr:phage tail sheath family protein [Nitrospira sp.]
MANPYAVPGVYYEPRPRAEPRTLPRTDVVGFIGFEPRVRDGTTATQLIGTPPIGHFFAVDVVSFQLPPELLGGVRGTVPETTDLVLSEDKTSIPIGPGGSIIYALVATVSSDGKVDLLVITGSASIFAETAPPIDEDIVILTGGRQWIRIANIQVHRSLDGAKVFPIVIPTLPPTRCNDSRDFELWLGSPPRLDDGTFLRRAVRAYFANGGARCYVATIQRPRFDDVQGLEAAIEQLVGIQGASEMEATGLEQLLRIFEVAIVDAPDLYTRHIDPDIHKFQLPPRDRDACFRFCDDTFGVKAGMTAIGEHRAAGPIFTDNAVLVAQKAMLRRCATERWRVLLLLTAPVSLDVSTGTFRGRDTDGVMAWRKALHNTVDDMAAAVGAFYHPWLLTQEKIGAPIVELPPTALAAGIIARRDISRGPHIAPANERLIGVVGLSQPVDDATNGTIYESPLNINPIRTLPGLGVHLWGARTLSNDRWMRYVPVRRCLSAIERRVLAALRPLVFEPNTPTLWFQIVQAVLSILVPVFNSGALRGDTPEQAYYVRCDDSNNPPDTIAAGQVLCEVGVAIAAPAEFIVFRVGRREAVVEVLE